MASFIHPSQIVTCTTSLHNVPTSMFPTSVRPGLFDSGLERPSEADSSLLSPLHSVSESNISICCQVCLQEAANIRRCYNARVCDSCRVFFRRSITSSGYQTMICKNSNPGQCQVSGASLPPGKICRKCRFDRCLSIGMKSSLVVLPKKVASTGVTMPIKSVKTQLKQPSLPAPSKSIDHLSLKEHQHWFKHTCKKKALQEWCRLYLNKLTLFHECLLVQYHGQSCSSDLIQWSLGVLGQTFWRFIHTKFPLYKDSINPHDHAVLVLARGPMMMEAMQLVLFLNRRDYLQEELQWLSATDPGNNNLHILLSLISLYKSSSPLHNANLTYGQMFHSPWAMSQELEDRHKELADKQFQIIQELKDLDEDTFLQVFDLLIFYSPNEPGLTDPSGISKMKQAGLNFVYQLLSSICKSEQEGLVKLNHFLELIPLLHESSEISRRRLPV